jgi:hypothetical protein
MSNVNERNKREITKLEADTPYDHDVADFLNSMTIEERYNYNLKRGMNRSLRLEERLDMSKIDQELLKGKKIVK